VKLNFLPSISTVLQIYTKGPLHKTEL